MQEPQSDRQVSGLAIASLTLSCLSVVIGPFGCIPGVICGHLARRECMRNWRVGGEGLALAGLIVGYVFTSLFGLVVMFALLIASFGQRRSDLISPVPAILPGAHVDSNNTIETGSLIETSDAGSPGVVLDAEIEQRTGSRQFGDDEQRNGFGGLVIEAEK